MTLLLMSTTYYVSTSQALFGNIDFQWLIKYVQFKDSYIVVHRSIYSELGYASDHKNDDA